MWDHLTLIGVCIFLAIFYILEKYKNNKTVNNLLDRLMAKDYKEYAAYEQQKEISKQRPERLVVTRDESDDTLPIS